MRVFTNDKKQLPLNCRDVPVRAEKGNDPNNLAKTNYLPHTKTTELALLRIQSGKEDFNLDFLLHLGLKLNLLLLANPLRGMGAWWKIMEPKKQDNFPGPGPEVLERPRVAKGRAVQSVRSWTVQDEMQSVLERITADAA